MRKYLFNRALQCSHFKYSSLTVQAFRFLRNLYIYIYLYNSHLVGILVKRRQHLQSDVKQSKIVLYLKMCTLIISMNSDFNNDNNKRKIHI